MDFIAGLLKQIKASSLWFVVPSAALAVAVGLTVVGYTPLMFDPSQYQTQSALAAELTSVDAAKIESSKSKKVKGDAEFGELEDGTWTGYAPCGEGNSDGWKPYYVAVTVEVKDGKIVSITAIEGSSTGEEGSTQLVWDAAENQEYLDRAINGAGGDGVKAQLDSQIAESGTVSGIDTVSGATYSSTAIYNALVNALKKSSGQEVGATSVNTNTGTSAAANVSVDAAPASTGLADGTWTGAAACGKGSGNSWKPYYVVVTIQVKNGKVVKITKVEGSSTGEKGSGKLNWDAAENQKYLTWGSTGRDSDKGVTTQINNALKAGKNISNIDTVTGATYSSVAIFNAYATAVNKAAKAGGSKDTTKQKKDKNKKNKKKKKKQKKVDGNPGVDDKAKLADGTFTGYNRCTDNDQFDYYLAVDVVVKNGKVTAIKNVRPTMQNDSGGVIAGEYDTINDSYFDWAVNGKSSQTGVLAQLKNAAKANKIPTSIDAVSGATYSSESLLYAYYDALKKSAAEAGSSAEVPDVPEVPDEPDPSGGSDDPDPSGGSDDPDPSGGSEDPENPDDPGDDQGEYVDGDYTEYAFCADSAAYDPYYIGVTINVTDGKITAITDVFGDAEGVVDPNYHYSAGQNKSYLDRAIKGYGIAGRHPGVVTQINNALAKGTVPTTCDTISGATYSSIAIIEAWNKAVESAKAPAEG